MVRRSMDGGGGRSLALSLAITGSSVGLLKDKEVDVLREFILKIRYLLIQNLIRYSFCARACVCLGVVGCGLFSCKVILSQQRGLFHRDPRSMKEGHHGRSVIMFKLQNRIRIAKLEAVVRVLLG